MIELKKKLKKKFKLLSPTQKKGHYYEGLALKFLKKNGLKLISQNYSASCGEIDLIVKEKETIVFVEVRFRNNKKYGSAIESIHFAKQQKIIKTAKLFLLQYGLYEKASCRFDVIGLTIVNNQIEYQWIKSAFQ